MDEDLTSLMTFFLEMNIEIPGDEFINIVVPHRGKMFGKPVRETLFCFTDIRLTTFIARDEIVIEQRN